MLKIWIYQFFFALIFIPVLDAVWLGKVMRFFYVNEIGPMMRPDVLYGPAAVVYILLALGLMIFALPSANGEPVQALLYGLALGAIIYGVYDFTNFATLQVWSLKLSLVDMAWGSFVCGFTAYLIQLTQNKFFNT